MNGNEYHTAMSLSGLMKLNITKEQAWEMIKDSDYCAGIDEEKVFYLLNNMINGETYPKQSDLPDELFDV
jgi:hypothetical protein